MTTKQHLKRKYQLECLTTKALAITCFCFILVMIAASGNFYVIMENNYKMPVKDYDPHKPDYVVFYDKSEVKHAWLADIFDAGKFIFSLGDMLGFVAVILLISNFIIYYKKNKELR